MISRPAKSQDRRPQLAPVLGPSLCWLLGNPVLINPQTGTVSKNPKLVEAHLRFVLSCMGEKSSVFGLAEKQNGKMKGAANLGGLIFIVRFYCANSMAGSSRCSIDRHRY